MKRPLAFILALVMLIGLIPQIALPVRAEEVVPAKSELTGKTISILGDSISTFAGVSNNASYNSTIGSNAVYYKTDGATQAVYQADTWWQQTIDALGMELLVNNSWSGSCVLHTRSSTAGAYVDRCVQLHNDYTGEEPDIIAVFMGTNDFSYYQSKLGTADIDYNTLIVENADGTFAYATPTTSCEAYAIMLHKMRVRYPDAEIYCMTLLPRRADDYDNKDVVPQPTVFNAELEKIISHFGCTVVDLENCGIPTANEEFDRYITDKRVHPGPAGMDKMTEALMSAMLGTETEICDVSYTYTGIESDNSANTAIIGGSYKATLTVSEGYSDMDVVVLMGGEDVTDSVFADSAISIDCVTGDIVITATSKKIPAAYRWELDGNALASSGKNSNTPTLLGGSVSNGVMSNVYYNLAEQVVLRHDLPWVLEFKASGSWSGMIFSALKTSSVTGNTYFFKTTKTNGFIGFGEYSGSQYNNYGITLGDKGVDTTLEHTYLLENRIAADGSNMVHLLVDNVDYGAMNNYFIAGDKDQKQTVDWLNGKDLFFSYIGASGHAINKCALDYIQVIECVHTYKNGTCTACGEDIYPDILDGHIQMLPEDVYAHTNLWELLEPEDGYFYAGTHWGTLDDVVSVTIPVNPGDQIYASSFTKGIRVTFFDADGILVSVSYTEIKEEFAQNGYITVPEGAIAVNIPMWDSSTDNALKILTLERLDCQDHVFTQQETVKEPGLVTKGSMIRYCENCGYSETVDIPELMLPDTYTYKDGDASIVLPYRIYYPSTYELDTQTQYPIVIFYHGAGSRGNDNESQVLGKAMIDRLVDLNNCIIIAPQCDSGYQWVNTPWGNGSYDSTSIQRSIYLDASIALLDATILTERVNEDRLYAIGLSMGGYATWNVMMEYPEKFAAVVPVCGAADPSRANEVLGVAVWAFHGDKDTTVPVSGSREMIEAIRTLGGIDVRYTEYEGVGHASWVNAFAEPELTDWLFAQKKHTHTYSPVTTPPTCTEQGYTTYTCECGESYVDDYVEALGHDYSAGLCTVCGEDTVSAAIAGNTLSLTGELAKGTRIFAAAYDSAGRFAGAKLMLWQGEALREEIPVGDSVQILFTDENWRTLRKSITLK